jgi:transcriptional regulator with XRE-family HTH domain
MLNMEKSIYTDEYSAVVQLLKELRKSAGLTQVQMAELLGQTQSLFSKYERGELRFDIIQLRTVAAHLGLSSWSSPRSWRTAAGVPKFSVSPQQIVDSSVVFPQRISRDPQTTAQQPSAARQNSCLQTV